MATKKSNIITNLDADPRVMNATSLSGGRVYGAVATIEVAAADNNADVLRMFRVHSSWIVPMILTWNDAITSGTQYDLGLYQIPAYGSAVLDADCWANNTTMVSARTTAGPLHTQFQTLDIDKIEKRVWEVGGAGSSPVLTVDPLRYFDVAWTMDAAGSGAGTISMYLQWIASGQ